MKQIILIGCLVFFSGSDVLPQPTITQNCPPNTVSVPLTYQFKDTDVQYAWIYHSLNPTLATVRDKVIPISTKIEDGALKMTFCIPTPVETKRLNLRVGPRAYDLAIRPITKLNGGAKEMSPIQLIKQPRPDWVIIKSFKRLNPKVSDYSSDIPCDLQLPSFEIELFNFGQAHPGGKVIFETSETNRFCEVASQPARVTVQVSLSGQRLQIASSDPEYPEELITRNAELVKNINWCAANFSLRADFGPTGRLPSGPIRIRYTLKRAVPEGSTQDIQQMRQMMYYFNQSYRLKVIGEGIW